MAGLAITFLGLSITSAWGNGHATTYRGLVGELSRFGHRVLFLERDVPWYAAHRDLPTSAPGRVALYDDLASLRRDHARAIRDSDVVVVGSYVPDGTEVLQWVLDAARGTVAFYDIDTPVTLAQLAAGDCEYLAPDLVPELDLYLSFTGGPTIERLERELGARLARPLYCAVDPEIHRPEPVPRLWDLGYLGTYSADRQPKLGRLLVEPAESWPDGRFVVAGPLYPPDIVWPGNVERIEHLPPQAHPRFYNAQRFTLNLTRADMVAAGWSPSVRLFEAAACAVPIISDGWPGLAELFEPGTEIIIAETGDDVRRALRETDEVERRAIGRRARRRVLAAHTAAQRARAFERYVDEARHGAARSLAAPAAQQLPA